jgi:hypothetical protein
MGMANRRTSVEECPGDPTSQRHLALRKRRQASASRRELQWHPANHLALHKAFHCLEGLLQVVELEADGVGAGAF